MAKGGGLEGYGALVLRLTLGVIFVMHAYQIAFLWGPGDIVTFDKAYGMPFPRWSIWYVIAAHGIGGLFLILGVLVRLAALANVPVVLIALVVVHLKQGFFMDRDGGYELALLVLLGTVAQAFLGPGVFRLQR